MEVMELCDTVDYMLLLLKGMSDGFLCNFTRPLPECGLITTELNYITLKIYKLVRLSYPLCCYDRRQRYLQLYIRRHCQGNGTFVLFISRMFYSRFTKYHFSYAFSIFLMQDGCSSCLNGRSLVLICTYGH